MLEVMGGCALAVSDNPDDAAGQIAAFLSDPAAMAANAEFATTLLADAEGRARTMPANAPIGHYAKRKTAG